MIIYGWNSSSLNQSKPENIVCPNCEAQGTTTIDARSRYAHIFWIPIFPYGKTGYSQCSECGQEYKKKKMTEEMKAEYKELSQDKKPPAWQFIGAVVILTGIIMLWNSSRKDDLKYHEMLESPEVGDVYRYKTEEGHYSTYRVYDVHEDSIDLIPNMYEYSQMTGIEEIEDDSNYADFYLTYPRDLIMGWLDRDTIYKILRTEVTIDSEDDLESLLEELDEADVDIEATEN